MGIQENVLQIAQFHSMKIMMMLQNQDVFHAMKDAQDALKDQLQIVQNVFKDII